jgi:hypothetical protein
VSFQLQKANANTMFATIMARPMYRSMRTKTSTLTVLWREHTIRIVILLLTGSIFPI